MKLVSYEIDDQVHLGVLTENGIVNLHQASNGDLPNSALALLQLGETALEAARHIVGEVASFTPLDSVKLLAPIPDPSKVIGIGLNYMDHVREIGAEVPEFPTMFCKYPSSVIGHGETIRWSSKLTQKVDYEAELAVVVGKTARHVTAENAYQYIAGYTICNDISARDLQFRTGDQWLRGKCLDSFCPLGPYLVTRDDIPDPHQLRIQCRVNNELVQDSNTTELICKIPQLIEYLSLAFTLLPGDVIITGTPGGVGAFREPPLWLSSGDTVSVEIDGLGCLTNPCALTD